MSKFEIRFFETVLFLFYKYCMIYLDSVRCIGLFKEKGLFNKQNI